MTGKIFGAADLTADVDLDADVCIVGSGAGGAVLAVGLVAEGLDVVMLEAGGPRVRGFVDRVEVGSAREGEQSEDRGRMMAPGNARPRRRARCGTA